LIWLQPTKSIEKDTSQKDTKLAESQLNRLKRGCIAQKTVELDKKEMPAEKRLANRKDVVLT
jgi:hypothetical protein